MGVRPLLFPLYHNIFSSVNEVDGQLITRDVILWQLKANLEASSNRMKQTID
jgi:hypothetical protein